MATCPADDVEASPQRRYRYGGDVGCFVLLVALMCIGTAS